MKKIWTLLFIIIGCTPTRVIAPDNALGISVIIYTNYQLTEAHKQDSIRISNLEKMVVMLDTSQWSKNGNTVTMNRADSFTVSYLMVTGPKTNPHDGNDTLIPDPNQRR